MDYEWKDMSGEDQIHEYYFPSISNKYSNGCIFETGIKEITKNNALFFSFDIIQKSLKTPSDDSDATEKLNYITNFYKNIIVENRGYFVDNSKYNFETEGISSIEGHPSVADHTNIANILFLEITSNEQL